MKSILSIAAVGLMSSVVLAGGAMVDPTMDDPKLPWCYLAKSTTVIGVPYMPGAVMTVAAPPLLSDRQRRDAFTRQFGRIDPATPPGLAVGKPATASASLSSYPPSKAVDGDSGNLQSSWQSDPYPAWLKIDLQKAVKIGRIHVFPYWGARRFYRYTVEVSQDGKKWHRVADMSGNTRPATPKGDDHRFEPRLARYLRVNMLHHSLNRGVHLVEVRAYEK